MLELPNLNVVPAGRVMLGAERQQVLEINLLSLSDYYFFTSYNALLNACLLRVFKPLQGVLVCLQILRPPPATLLFQSVLYRTMALKILVLHPTRPFLRSDYTPYA